MSTPESIDPTDFMMKWWFEKTTYFAISAIAQLGIADHLTESPRCVDEVAVATSTHGPSLYRVLRTLTCVGLFREEPERHFSLTKTGLLLQTANPRSMRDLVIMLSSPWNVQSWLQLPDVIRTGTDGVTLAYGKPMFDLLRELPEESARFNGGMTGFSANITEQIIRVADFSRFKRVSDVGGGHGLFLSYILRKFPEIEGVLFDLPEVIAGAPATGNLAGLDGRVSYDSGTFFERIPDACDAYTLKFILHDWDDENCRLILSKMREQLLKTAPVTGRVFVIEMVLTPEKPSPAHYLDTAMLVVTKGRERTAEEFSKLFQSAGLKLISITPTGAPQSLIEAAVAL